MTAATARHNGLMDASREAPAELVYRVDRLGAWRATAFHAALATAVLTAAAVILWVTPSAIAAPQWLRMLALVVGLVGFVAFAGLAWRFARRVRSAEPLIVLRRYGMYENVSAVFTGVGWVAWADVADVRVAEHQGVPCVHVVLRPDAELVSRAAWARRGVGWGRRRGERRMTLLRRARGGMDRADRGSLVLQGPLLPVEPDELAEEIRRRWRTAAEGEASGEGA